MNKFILRNRRKAKTLARSFFDHDFYIATYGDVAEQGQDPFEHYLAHGWREGRDPSRTFSTLYYKDKYMVEHTTARNPLVHHCRLSRAIRRKRKTAAGSDFADIQAGIIAPHFDETYYEKVSLLSSKSSMLSDSLNGGWRRGFEPVRWFNSRVYTRIHWYINFDIVNPFYHYITTQRHFAANPAVNRNGRLEGSNLLSAAEPSMTLIGDTDFGDDHLYEVIKLHFDNEYYLHTYEDVRNSDIHPLVHFIRDGARENRNPNADFVTIYYKDHYPSEIGSENPFYHYITQGQHIGLRPHPEEHGKPIAPPSIPGAVGEGAAFNDSTLGEVGSPVYDIISANFDRKYYIKHYHDVRDAGIDPVKHFINHGSAENRNPSEFFSTSYYRKRYTKDISSLNPFYHYLTEGQSLGFKPNPYGYTVWPSATTPTETEWREVLPARDLENCQIALIMPVYKGYSDTLRSIHSVLAAANTTRHALIVIDDASPDADLSLELKRLASRGYFILLVNEQNLGFVRTVNRGLAYTSGKDVVLLNADIVVFGDWLDRMVHHAEADPRIATITPFSNNATICSYPVANQDNVLQLEVDAATLDRFTARCNAGGRTEVPTGVGFCFYMRRSIIDEVGPLDPETFGRGYGEENDFCMRALRKGYRNVIAHDIFVYHSGSVSFGDVQSSQWTGIRDAILSKHPDYFSRIQIHLQTDPVRDARSRLDLYRLAALIGTEPVIFITHSMGGGIETHIQQLSAKFLAEGRNVVVFRTSKPDLITIDLPEGNTVDFPTDILRQISLSKNADMLADFIGWLKPHAVHVHSFAALSWRATKTLMQLIPNWAPFHYLTLHDFEFACHRYNLIKPNSTFCGLAKPTECRVCIAMDKDVQGPPDPEERRDTFRAFAETATRVFSPSRDTALRATAILRETDIVVRPHENAPNAITWSHQKTLSKSRRVAVIGAIGPHKGSYVLYALAQDAMTRGLDISYTIIGYSHDRAFMETVGVHETGKYDTEEEALELLRDGDFDFIFLPSIFPETYCYALSMAMHSGIPTLSFDIGAQAERLGAVNPAYLIDYRLRDDPIALNDHLMRWPETETMGQDARIEPINYNSVIDYYGDDAVPRA